MTESSPLVMTLIEASHFFWRQELTKARNLSANPRVLNCANKLKDAGMHIASPCLGNNFIIKVLNSPAMAWIQPWPEETNPSGMMYFVTIYRPSWNGWAKDGSANSLEELVALLKRESIGRESIDLEEYCISNQNL